MEEVKPKKYPLKWIGIGAIIGVVIIASLIFAYSILNRPNPQIILLDGHDGFQGVNYVAYVDVSVKNNGGDGWVTVYAEIEGAGKYEKKEQRIYMASGETKQLQFVFDISFWNALFSSLNYRAWAVPS
jgi:hypothetical protein